MKYRITTKSGHVYIIEHDKNPVGLWIWSLKQYTPQILSFGDTSIIATEIAAIEAV